MKAPTDRLPVEIWQDILLFAIEPDVGASVFAITCTASTFLHFPKKGNGSYHEYTRRRAMLRQGCRAWNEFLHSTKSWWVHVHNTDCPKQKFALPSIPDQVRTVKRLSMIIPCSDRQYVGPSVDWASDLLTMSNFPHVPILYFSTANVTNLMIFSQQSVSTWLSANLRKNTRTQIKRGRSIP